MTATVEPLRCDSLRARSARSRNNRRFASPLNGSCSDSRSCLMASRALLWTASSGSASNGRSSGDVCTATTPTGASATSTPDVVAWKRMSSRKMSTRPCRVAIATTVEISRRFTTKKVAPAASAAPSSEMLNRSYLFRNGSCGASVENTALAATSVRMYWLRLKTSLSGLRRALRSSNSTAAHWTNSANPIGPTITSITAAVVEMVIWSVLSSPREMGIGRSSPRTSEIASRVRTIQAPSQPAHGGWCSQTVPAASTPQALTTRTKAASGRDTTGAAGLPAAPVGRWIMST